jgi:hypothetical protein
MAPPLLFDKSLPQVGEVGLFSRSKNEDFFNGLFETNDMSKVFDLDMIKAVYSRFPGQSNRSASSYWR